VGGERCTGLYYIDSILARRVGGISEETKAVKGNCFRETEVLSSDRSEKRSPVQGGLFLWCRRRVRILRRRREKKGKDKNFSL